MKNFVDLSTARNQNIPSEQVPQNLLESLDPVILCRWLSLFLAETRKQNGQPYPPKTLYILLCGIHRHMKRLNSSCPNIMDVKNPDFAPLHTSLDNVFRDSRSDGVGSTSESAEVFTKEEENELWSKGIVGVKTPKSLVRSVFFLNGKISVFWEVKITVALKYLSYEEKLVQITMCILKICLKIVVEV